jgi:hypothetical protein
MAWATSNTTAPAGRGFKNAEEHDGNNNLALVEVSRHEHACLWHAVQLQGLLPLVAAPLVAQVR